MPELSGIDTILEYTHEFLNVKVVAISGVNKGGCMDAKWLIFGGLFGVSGYGDLRLLRGVNGRKGGGLHGHAVLDQLPSV